MTASVAASNTDTSEGEAPVKRREKKGNKAEVEEMTQEEENGQVGSIPVLLLQLTVSNVLITARLTVRHL